MLINLSNHPSALWAKAQIDLAKKQFGEVADVPFPQVPPRWSLEQVKSLAGSKVESILKEHGRCSLLIAGEQSFVVAAVSYCSSKNIPCFCGTSERITKLLPDGRREVTFEFVTFRKLY